MINPNLLEAGYVRHKSLAIRKKSYVPAFFHARGSLTLERYPFATATDAEKFAEQTLRNWRTLFMVWPHLPPEIREGLRVDLFPPAAPAAPGRWSRLRARMRNLFRSAKAA